MDHLEELYQQHSKGVYFFLLSLSRDAHLAEELTQETMFRAIINMDAFRGDSKLSVWLCRIAKNLYLDWLEKSRRTVPLAEDTLCQVGDDPAEQTADQDLARQILSHLEELREPYRSVFALHTLNGLPLTEISRQFGKSDSWARVTYYRAKAMILSKLEEGTP